MGKSQIRRSVFIPVVAGLLVLAAIITASLHWYQAQHLEETVSDRLTMVTKAFDNQLASDADVLDGLTEFLKKEPSLQQAFLAGDRAALLKATQPIFEGLHAQHRVTHFYFCDPKRVCFLRVHEPTRYGDAISRHTALRAVATGKPSRGLDLGTYGTLTLRVVHPWVVAGQLIGYLELGEEIDHLLPRIGNLADVQLLITVNKASLDKASWEAGMKMLKRPAAWDRYRTFVIVDSTMSQDSESLDALLSIPHSEHNNRIYPATVAGRAYRGGLLPLVDASGRDVGELVALVDVTRDAQALSKTLIAVLAATLIFFALILRLFWAYLGRMEHSLIAAMGELSLARHVAEQHAVRLGTLSRAVEQCPVGITITSPDGTIEFANPGYSQMTRYSSEEVLGMSALALLADERAHDIEVNIQDTLAMGDTWRGEMRLRKKNGGTFWGHTTIATVVDKQNSVTNCVGITVDITERKQAAEELLEYAGSLARATAEIKQKAADLAVSELKYRTLFDSSRDAILIVTPEDGIVDGNPAAAQLFGCRDAEELATFSPAELSPERQPDGTLSTVKAERMMLIALKNGSHFFEWTHRRRNGRVFPTTVLLTRVMLEGKQMLQATVRDTTEEKRAAEALKIAKEGAEAASLAKSAFLANISHELRTPLHGVVGMTELLRGTPLEERQRQFVDACHASGKSLLELINDILDFSRIEAGKLELSLREFHLGQVLSETVEALQFEARRKGLSLVLCVAPEVDRWVRGDDARLRQVLLNLLGNAVKFSDSGEVTVRVEPAGSPKDENHVRFEITDKGIGIAADRIDRLFLSFSQADPSITRKYGGSGLGLAISKRLVELMGGTIGVASRLGQGSTFWFVIPLGAAHAGAQQSASGDEAPESDALRFDAILRGRKALLVEDNRVNRMFAEEVLRQANLTCRTAESGLQAIEALRRESFDVVLMDCQMPEMDGFRTTQCIRDMERDGQIAGRTPIIAITANAVKGDRERCLECGMDDYIAKPFTSQQLIEMIARLLMPSETRQSPEMPTVVTEPPPDSDLPIDCNGLLGRCRGNVEFVQSLLAEFEQELPRRVDQIIGDVSQQNAAAAVESAHALKGAAGTMAAEPLRAAAAEIEMASKSRELTKATAATGRLRAEAERCLRYIPELKQKIDALPAGSRPKK
jgi:PAS domain S-box-containing protein